MTEPTQVERKAPGHRGPTAPLANGESRGGIRSTLRGKTFAEGEQLLAPETPVQLKPDPKPKPGSGTQGRIDALEAENAALTEKVTGLEAENAQQRQNAEDLKAGLIKTNEGLVLNGLDTINSRLRDAGEAMGALEALVEATLVDDERLAASDVAVDKAIDAHREANKPGLLDGLTMLVDIASLVKSGITLGAKLGQKALAEVNGKAGAAAAAVDALGSALTFGKDADNIEGRAKREGADTTTTMVKALDTKIDANSGSIETLREHAFGKEKYAVGAALTDAATARDQVQRTANSIREHLSPKLETEIDNSSEKLKGLGLQSEARLVSLQRLLKARDPKAGGGGELSKDSAGRNVFEIIARNPEACRLFAEMTLHVTTTGPGKHNTEERRSDRYWLQVNDPALKDALVLRMFPYQVHNPSRPVSAPKDTQFVPAEMGRPLSTLIETNQLPYWNVRLYSALAITPTTTRDKWEDPDERELLFASTRPRRGQR